MRRFVYLGLIVAILPWIVIGIVRESTDDDTTDHYFVRAIFDNASTLVAGEDVKIAGAPVGVISDMDVTRDKKAAVTLRIDDEGFVPFKRDASCVIRLQGLIGERFVECEPGSASSPRLAQIEDGDGKGERLLPVENTSSPVDLDLLNSIMRLPYRQRFAILISELGTGLAGRGEQLNEVIHRANPALRETDEVLAILAGQNRALARLAKNSDRALAPLSRERERFGHWIVAANETGEASAERRVDIARGIDRLPAFLSELRLLMVDLESVTDQGTPLLADLGAAAPDLGRLIRAQGTLADASRDAFPSLGDALERGRPALIEARPLVRDLARLGKELAPTSVDLDALTASLEKTGAIERLNDFLYYLALSTNGFDSLGHYLRAGLVTNTCTEYATVSTGIACTANFTSGFEGASASSNAGPLAARNAPEPPKGSRGGSVPPTGTLLEDLLGTGADPELKREREANLEALRQRASQGSSGLPASEPVLDYLLGGAE
jgi:phospholipid/cholesterol/gamma-HCH transport system substrate-binding protein